MNEIKSINIVHNNDVSILIPDEDNEHICEIVHFIPKNKSGEWLVDIIYNLSTAEDRGYTEINGTITFINSENPDEKIKYEFSDDSFIEHGKNHDRIVLRSDENNNLSLDIFYDKNNNAIINGIDITTTSNKFTDNPKFIDYNSLEINSLEGYLTVEDSLKTIKEHVEDCGTSITFGTDYYHNNYADFNPWINFHS